jgi:hypothetical protein
MDKENKKRIRPSFLPDPEEIQARVEASRSHWRDLRNSIDLENTFCPVDLGDWIDLCQKAGVPYVAAEKIADVSCEDVVRFDEPGEHQERTRPFWAAVNAYKESALEAARDVHAYEMLRWSCCAPLLHRGRSRSHDRGFPVEDLDHMGLVHADHRYDRRLYAEAVVCPAALVRRTNDLSPDACAVLLAWDDDLFSRAGWQI